MKLLSEEQKRRLMDIVHELVDERPLSGIANEAVYSILNTLESVRVAELKEGEIIEVDRYSKEKWCVELSRQNIVPGKFRKNKTPIWTDDDPDPILIRRKP